MNTTPTTPTKPTNKKTYTFTNPKNTFTSETPTAGAPSSGLSAADAQKLIDDALVPAGIKITTLETKLQQCLNRDDYTSARNVDFQIFRDSMLEEFAAKAGFHGTIKAIVTITLSNRACIEDGTDQHTCDQQSYNSCVYAIGIATDCHDLWPV